MTWLNYYIVIGEVLLLPRSHYCRFVPSIEYILTEIMYCEWTNHRNKTDVSKVGIPWNSQCMVWKRDWRLSNIEL